VVQEGLSLDDVQQTLAAFRWTLALALPVTLALASVVGLFLASRALRPVDQITRAAQSISAQDLSRRLNLDLPDDELGRLARTFDAMIARLDEAFRRQRRFTADASHELRTPLTIIKGDLSLALARPRDADYYRQVLAEADEEVDHMSHLVERLLALARADAEGLPLHRQMVNLSDLLADLIEQTRPLAEAKGLPLTAQIAPGLIANVDPDAVTQVVLNLLENAIKYTPSGRVRLSAHLAGPDKREIRIAISDSGSGIPAEHLPHIFDRFYRVDRARSRELGGVGLGLSIARELARAHGGDVTVHSVSGEGSTFAVHLPLR
jgi:heavy metal sensor kinase